MGSQMPELGSKISLISKADIRYEGQLFTVDPAECTIALANVRSFGTENRETQYPVPAQSQVYDYILFRGTDIKDIKVLTNQQIPNDPAIVQLVPPSINQQGFQAPAFSHPLIGTSLSQYGSYGAMGGLQRAPGPLIMQPSELGGPAGVHGPPQGEPPLQPSTGPIGPHSIDKEQDLMGGVSRSTTPSVTRKSPTNDQGTQVSSPSRDERKNPRPIQPPQRGDRREQPLYQPGQGFQRERDYHSGYRRDYQQRDRGDYQQRDRGDFQGRDRGEYQQRDRGDYQQRDRGDYQQRDRGDYQQRDRGDYRDPFQQRRGNRPRGDNQPRDEQLARGAQGQGSQPVQGGWVQRGNMARRGGVRPRGPPKQFNRQGSGTATGKKNSLKFDGDYDFDKANTEFEELRSQLAKTKISNDVDGAVPAPPEAKVNGEAEKKDDSGNETGAGENEHEDESIQECYNKSKSFFDTISCEAVERSKGRSQRTDWRTERKLNSETFGVASARRGAFRGRGYYGGRQGFRPHAQGGFRPRGPPREQSEGQVEVKQPEENSTTAAAAVKTK